MGEPAEMLRRESCLIGRTGSGVEAPLENADIVDYDPKCNGAKDYQAFADEFLSRIQST